MNRFSPALWLALALLCSSLIAQEPIKWQTDLGAARKASQQWRVPVLIHFYGDHCLPCKTLEHRVYSRPEVSKTINQYFIPVRVNASLDRRMSAEFQVHEWPTDVFVSPDGKTLAQGVCVQDANAYLQNLQNIAIMNRDRAIMLAAEHKPATPDQTQPTTSLANTQSPYGLLPAANSTQPPIGSFAPNQSNHSAIGSSSQYVSSLPPVGQANASTNLPNPVANAQSAGRINTAQPGSVQRGPVDFQSQPTAIHGAVGGTTSPFSSPNLPPPAQTMQTQYARQTQPVGPTLTWTPQPNTAQSTQPSSVSNMPNMIAAQTQNTPVGFPKSANLAQPRGLLVSNPHYPGAVTQDVSAMPENTNVLPQPQPTFKSSQPVATTAETSLILEDAKVPTHSAQNTAPSQTSPEIASNPAATPPTSVSSQLAFQPVSSPHSSAQNSGAVVATEKAAPTGLPEAEPTTALEGFCPVALIMSQKWIAGQESFAVKHRGKIYHMSSQPAMEAFLASPDRYTPVLSGYDPMVFLDRGELVPGSFEFGSIDLQTHAVYLFSSQADKDNFEKNFEANAKALNILITSSRTQSAH